MQPMLPEFKRIAAEITYHLPQIKLISNLTGETISREVASPEYWCQHILAPVNFAASIAYLAKENYQIFLEIGFPP